MDKNKQTKKRKLKTKLISIAMLAIILVSMLAVPTSAVEDDAIIGTWVLNDNLARVDANIWATFEGTAHWATEDGTVYDYSIARVKIYSSNFSFYIEGEENSVYPSISCLNEKVTVYPPNYPTDFDYYDIRIGEAGYTDCRTFTIETIPDNQDFIDYVQANATKVVPPPPNPIEHILDVFLGIGGWIATAVTSLIGIFYSAEAGKLTVIGVLSVASLAISVIFLLIGVIQNFMHFRS